jgi:hypothetical protein
MIEVPIENLKNMKVDEINRIDTKLFKLNSLKIKLKNGLTPAFGDDIEDSMLLRTSIKDDHIKLILIISNTTQIIRDYVMEQNITQSNSMESYQRDILHHQKKYSSIQGIEWKTIINNIITQYWKIKEPASFQTGVVNKILSRSKNQSFYKWIFNMIKCTIDTRQDFMSRNIWSTPESANTQ